MCRFNVYNTVKVTLDNQEFGSVSTKEVEVAKYLDMLQTVRLHKNDEELASFEEILVLSHVDSQIEAVKNNQSVSTPLCKSLQSYFKYSWRHKRDAQNHPSLRHLSNYLTLTFIP